MSALCCLLLCAIWGRALSATDEGQGSEPAWASPTARTLRRVGPAADVPEQPNFQSNLDCTELTYRQTDSSAMQAGCFMPTAFGLVEPDSDAVIFNGTDEAVPISPYLPHQVLTPWPGTINMLSLSAASTGGSYLSLYRNVTADLRDERDVSGRLVAKQLAAPPDMELKDPAGRPLVINAQTMAFSANGSWLVVETLTGAFVRINLATLDMTAFAPAYGALGNPALLKSQVAVSEDGRFVAVENTVADAFKVYDLAACSGQADNLRPQDCATYDYWPFITGQLNGLRSITHVRFVTDGILGFDASSATDVSTYELAPTDGIDALIEYLAVGDSYTSGEGAFDYEYGTDTGDDVCHLSSKSYPLLISSQLFASGRSVACSGARMQDVVPTEPNKYRGQVAGGIPADTRSADSIARVLADFTPGYLAQSEFVSHYQPQVLTVSVGGDDIGFGEMIENCVEPHVSLHLSDSTCFDTYEDRLELKNLIDRTIPKWTTLFRRLQSKSPLSRIYAIGYPQIAVDTGNCAANVHLNKGELEFSQEIVAYLNSAIGQASANAGIRYIDIAKALAGHRLCETDSYDVAVNGLTAGADGGPFGLKIFGKESYHPNALGQSLIAAAVLGQSHNLGEVKSDANDSGADPESAAALLDAPKSGRAVMVRVPDPDLVPPVINRGGKVTVHVDGAADGLRPTGSYTIYLDGAGGSVLGQLGSDQSASIDGSIDVPAGAAAGGHTIDIVGTGQGGDIIDVTQATYIAASDTDADGDGIPNASDTCPGAVNAGQDIDGDGVDDGCDAVIGQAVVGGGGADSLPPQDGHGSDGTVTPLNGVNPNSPLPEQGQKANNLATAGSDSAKVVGIFAPTTSIAVAAQLSASSRSAAIASWPKADVHNSIGIGPAASAGRRPLIAASNRQQAGGPAGPAGTGLGAAEAAAPVKERWLWAAAVGCWLLLLLIIWLACRVCGCVQSARSAKNGAHRV